jgi:hypothetical protein
VQAGPGLHDVVTWNGWYFHWAEDVEIPHPVMGTDPDLVYLRDAPTLIYRRKGDPRRNGIWHVLYGVLVGSFEAETPRAGARVSVVAPPIPADNKRRRAA